MSVIECAIFNFGIDMIMIGIAMIIAGHLVILKELKADG